MFEGSSIAVVVPCYREETQIRGVIETMPAFVDRIIVVDDRSPDRTADVVRECMSVDHRVELLVHEENRGVGAGIATSTSSIFMVLWLTRAIAATRPPPGTPVPRGEIRLLLAGIGGVDPDDGARRIQRGIDNG